MEEKKRSNLNTIFNFDTELNKADQMFNSFFSEDNKKRKRTKKAQELSDKFDDLWHQVEDKKELVYKIEKINRDTDKKHEKILLKAKNELKKELKKLQTETRKVRSNMANLDKFTDKITVKTSFGEFTTTYKEVYSNAGSSVEFFKKKLIAQIKRKAKDYKKEVRIEAQELKTLKPNSAKAKSIKEYAKKVKEFLSQIDDIIANINKEDDYPIMYDFNINEDYMRIYVVGQKGIGKYNKRRAKHNKKYGKQNTEVAFDFEEEVLNAYNGRKK